jgi:hypothetical protein
MKGPKQNNHQQVHPKLEKTRESQIMKGPKQNNHQQVHPKLEKRLFCLGPFIIWFPLFFLTLSVLVDGYSRNAS